MRNGREKHFDAYQKVLDPRRNIVDLQRTLNVIEQKSTRETFDNLARLSGAANSAVAVCFMRSGNSDNLVTVDQILLGRQ